MRALLLFLAGMGVAQAAGWPKPGDLVTNAGPTWSMGKAFPPGASARLLAVENCAGIVGFVVAMKDEGRERVIAHRCIATGLAANGRRWFITKGDGTAERDPVRWSEQELLGLLDLPAKGGAR